MKKLIIISVSILNIFILCNCFRSLSTTSFLVEKGQNIYLFGVATGKDGTSIVCRFTCSSVPTQQNTKELCNSPIYIEESALTKFQNLSSFLEDIKSSQLKVRDLTLDTQNTVNSAFARVEADGIYDADIGEPSEACSSVLTSNTGSVVTETSDSNNSNNSNNASAPTGVFTEISSLDEVKTGYPTLVVYTNVQTCNPCQQEHEMLERNQAKFKDKMHLYSVPLEKNSFSGNTLPCGGGIPQNQIFDKDKKQISCEAGFNETTQNYIQQLGISLE